MKVYKVATYVDHETTISSVTGGTLQLTYKAGQKVESPEAPIFAFGTLREAQLWRSSLQVIWECETDRAFYPHEQIHPLIMDLLTRPDVLAWWDLRRMDIDTSPVPEGTVICTSLTPIKLVDIGWPKLADRNAQRMRR